jgi:hypothetical protein
MCLCLMYTNDFCASTAGKLKGHYLVMCYLHKVQMMHND